MEGGGSKNPGAPQEGEENVWGPGSYVSAKKWSAADEGGAGKAYARWIQAVWLPRGQEWGWEWGSIPEAKVRRACPRLRLKQESRNPPTPAPSHTLSNSGRRSTVRVGGCLGERPLLYGAVT